MRVHEFLIDAEVANLKEGVELGYTAAANSVGAVIIASSTDTHAELILRAAAAGKPLPPSKLVAGPAPAAVARHDDDRRARNDLLLL